jgi:hypothetical protein
MVSVPRVIYSAWLQGRDVAPGVVKLCFDRWERLNPGYMLHVLESSGAAASLADVDVTMLPPQAYTDILRIKLLLEQGGVWADATLLPIRPLDDWLPAETAPGGFFAFARPGPDRPISSWFLVATPGHLIIQKIWDEIKRFWSRPRQFVTYGNGNYIPPDPVATVAPGHADTNGEYPYFWLHYLFRYLLESNPEFAASWALCPQVEALPTHHLQALCAGDPRAPAVVVNAVAHRAPVQKLNWRATYPLDLLAQI